DREWQVNWRRPRLEHQVIAEDSRKLPTGIADGSRDAIHRRIRGLEPPHHRLPVRIEHADIGFGKIGCPEQERADFFARYAVFYSVKNGKPKMCEPLDAEAGNELKRPRRYTAHIA